MAITYQAANRFVDYGFGKLDNLTTAVPANWYIGLSTSATIGNDGSGITEPSAGQLYARVAIPNGKSSGGSTWGNASNGVLTNKVAITFPESLATSLGGTGWGTINYIFLSDSSSVGSAASTIWFFEAITARTVQASTIVTFNIDALTISMTNA